MKTAQISKENETQETKDGVYIAGERMASLFLNRG